MNTQKSTKINQKAIKKSKINQALKKINKKSTKNTQK